MLSFSCPSCRQPVLIHESWGRKPAGCPHCGQHFLLPPVLGMDAPPARVESPNPLQPATDWSKVTGGTVPQAPIFPMEWEKVYRGLTFVQIAGFFFLVATMAWYVGLMVHLEAPVAAWRPVGNFAQLVAYGGLGLGLAAYLFGMTLCTRLPEGSPLRPAIRWAWFFSQIVMIGLLAALGDAKLGAPILSPDEFVWILLVAITSGIIGHFCFIRFLRGIALTFTRSPGRSNGPYQMFLAAVVIAHLAAFFLVDRANGQVRQIPHVRLLAAAAAALYLILEFWFCCLLAGARHNIRLGRQTDKR